MTDHEVLVENLQRLMSEQGYNNASLAAAAGLNPTGVRDIILGKSLDPKPGTIKKLAQALGKPAYELTQKTHRIEWLEAIAESTSDLSDQERRAVEAYVETLKSLRA